MERGPHGAHRNADAEVTTPATPPVQPPPTAEQSWRALLGFGLVIGIPVGVAAFIQAHPLPNSPAGWSLFFEGMTGIGTVLSFIALATAAVFAWRLIQTTRDLDRMRLTDATLNSGWLTTAVTNLYDLTTAEGSIGNLKRRTAAFASGTVDAERVRILSIYNSWIYLSRLYLAGAIDKKLTLDAVEVPVSRAAYVLEPLIRVNLRGGFIKHDLLMLSRECIDRIHRRPELMVYEHHLQDWRI